MLESVDIRRENILYPDASKSTYFIKAENFIATNIGRDFRNSLDAGSSWAIDFLRGNLYKEETSAFLPGVRVVVMRQKRGIVFSEEALFSLRNRGFIFVRLERMEHAAQVALFANASTVIAPRGAGLSSLAFCKPGTHVLEVFNGVYWTHAFYTVALWRSRLFLYLRRFVIFSSQSPDKRDCHIDQQIIF